MSIINKSTTFMMVIIIGVIILLLAFVFKDQTDVLIKGALSLFEQPTQEQSGEEKVGFVQSVFINPTDPPVSVVFKFFRYFNINYIHRNDTINISGTQYTLSPNKEVYNVFIFKFNQELTDAQIKCAILGEPSSYPLQWCPKESQDGGLILWRYSVNDIFLPPLSHITRDIEYNTEINVDNDCFIGEFLSGSETPYSPGSFGGDSCGSAKCRSGDYCTFASNCCPSPYNYYLQSDDKCYFKNSLENLHALDEGRLVFQKDDFPANKIIKIRVSWYYEDSSNTRYVHPLITVCGE